MNTIKKTIISSHSKFNLNVIRKIYNEFNFIFKEQNEFKGHLLSSYYYQSIVDEYASKSPVRLQPMTMLYQSKSTGGEHLLRSGQYLHRELLVRLAHRISLFRKLPFILSSNPSLLSLHERYIKALYKLHKFPKVKTIEIDRQFCLFIQTLLEDYKDVVNTLADGLYCARKHIVDQEGIKIFLDKLLVSRMSTHLLCKHHLKLHKEKGNNIGVILFNFSPTVHIEQKAEHIRKICLMKYNAAPAIIYDGHLHDRFIYIPQPFGLIVSELLKNAMIATLESNHDKESSELPPIRISISNNDREFIIRISDGGKGLSDESATNIWKYNFSRDRRAKEQWYDTMQDELSNGLGFGLPACKAYAEYLGGGMSFVSMRGHGTDVYLRLGHIDVKGDSFRI